jgi:hypothetical protein
MPHESAGAPLVEQRSAQVELGAGRLGQPAARQRIEDVLTVLGKARGIPFDDPFHPWLATAIGSPLGDAVELRDSRRERWHQFEIQTPGGSETVEERLLREAIHFHYPIDGRI